MTTVIELAQIILLLSAAALCIFLIYYVGNITKSIKEIQIDLHKMSQDLEPAILSLEKLSATLSSLSNDAKHQLAKVTWLFDEIKSKVESVFNFQDRIREKFENPAQGLLNNLDAIKNGVSAFWHSIKRKN
ncbi:MAG: hypothetical protein AB9882_01175 [Ignavibacteriaceae bacterium]